jgi:hypothetical protein
MPKSPMYCSIHLHCLEYTIRDQLECHHNNQSKIIISLLTLLKKPYMQAV